ncbi:macro domain-containing protein [Desnuesiella massiliensis]|uniref:macro domain-containing protein n=1 Tax=Desnuesiella massiliensis TaxID=1650662 RepID=UPI0006E2E171|nr:macro domain-containing protein [Desnuesiella massiliensis]
MIKTIEGNILDATENVICHQVNCMGVMGSGLAKQIRAKYPNVFEQYHKFVLDNGKLQSLGMCQIVEVGKDKYVSNLFGQYNYGTNKIQTDYAALKSAMSSLKTVCKESNLSVALPYNLGCGLAGGDWGIVSKMIEDIFEDYDVMIYRFK